MPRLGYARPATERLVATLVEFTNQHAHINATTLAERFDVSTKTVHRDLDFIRDRLLIPLAYDPAKFRYKATPEALAKISNLSPVLANLV